MLYRKLGRTDINVSAICLGTMTFGEQNTQAEAFDQMDYAAANGVNFFDTAELYAIPPKAETYGRTEEFVGNWFEKSGKRQDIVLATKIVGPAPQMPWIRGGYARLEKTQIHAALDGSLKRLKTDYIDLYQIHWPQRPVNSFGKLGFDQVKVTQREGDVIAETMDTMAELIRAGKIRHVGLSNETPWGVMQYLRHDTRIVSIQNPYSLVNRTFDIGLAEIAMQEDVGLLAYAPLGAGVLSGKYLDGQIPKGSRWDIDPRPSRYNRPLTEPAVKGYMDVAKKYGIDHIQMAIAFVAHRPFVTSAIIGATTLDQLRPNIDAIDVTLSDEILRDLDAVHAAFQNPCP